MFSMSDNMIRKSANYLDLLLATLITVIQPRAENRVTGPLCISMFCLWFADATVEFVVVTECCIMMAFR